MPRPRCSTGTAWRQHRLNATGYSLGAVYAPSWMDWPMFYAGNPVVIGPGMAFFLHMILMDSDTRPRDDAGPHLAGHANGAPSRCRAAPLELILRD